MTTPARWIWIGALTLLLAAPPLHAFVTQGSRWAPGYITMHLQLGPGSGVLIDGSTNWDDAFTQAMTGWNTYLDTVKFETVPDSPVPMSDGDLVNHVAFDSHYYGEGFEPGTLAVTIRWTSRGSRRVETDIVFNSAHEWNAYRGNARVANGREVVDIVRVGLHELGHALGLDHPDEHGQRVNAVMNSVPGNQDQLTADDIAGAQWLYGSTGTRSNIASRPQ